MGKRSDFPWMKQDSYDTPAEAVIPLLPHLPSTKFEYIEPCAGAGYLISHLESHGVGVCRDAFDIAPRESDDTNYLISEGDATKALPYPPDFFITNPPWTREILHAIILNLCRQAPTWLLIDADWAHTKQAIPMMRHCRRIVSIGRVKWFPETGATGKDNCAWYLFDRDVYPQTQFFART